MLYETKTYELEMVPSFRNTPTLKQVSEAVKYLLGRGSYYTKRMSMNQLQAAIDKLYVKLGMRLQKNLYIDIDFEDIYNVPHRMDVHKSDLRYLKIMLAEQKLRMTGFIKAYYRIRALDKIKHNQNYHTIAQLTK